jgi:hypothetical protein
MLRSRNVRDPQHMLDQRPIDSLNPAHLVPPRQTIEVLACPPHDALGCSRCKSRKMMEVSIVDREVCAV